MSLSTILNGDWAFVAGMYDVALSPEQIVAMYKAVFKDTSSPATVFSSKLMTKSGKVCSFPTDIRGKPIWTSCQNLRGIPACPVSSGQWEVRLCSSYQQTRGFKLERASLAASSRLFAPNSAGPDGCRRARTDLKTA